MKEIPHIKNYFVCSEGFVYNKQGLKLKTQLSRDGYEMISFWQKGENKSRTFSVHRLVAITLLPNPDDLPCVNHIDGNKRNNKIENLEWCTYSHNTTHSFELGLQKPRFGEDVHNCVYTDEKVHEVCRLMEQEYRNVDIAKIAGVTTYFVKLLRAGKTREYISSQYSFPTKSRKRYMSEETIRWICNKIIEGYSNVEIANMANCPLATRQTINRIRNKKGYTDIVSEYDF